jgi:alkanesulfonate monooxygenase SsuD/methylene tetrahydromethanopterin reductase-like flavin-dependent oxidoreductase (luciferase family)
VTRGISIGFVAMGDLERVAALEALPIDSLWVADLDRATSGRVVLGVGVGGGYPEEFRACGVPIEERGPRTDEAIALIRELWSGHEISHDGAFYAMARVRSYPPPAQAGGRPIVVAGRDLSRFGWYAFVFLNVDRDGDRARAGRGAHAGRDLRPGLRGDDRPGRGGRHTERGA